MTIQVILIIGCVVFSVITFIIGLYLRAFMDKKYRQEKIAAMQEESDRILREAQKEAELSKKPPCSRQRTNGSGQNRNSRRTRRKQGKPSARNSRSSRIPNSSSNAAKTPLPNARRNSPPGKASSRQRKRPCATRTTS